VRIVLLCCVLFLCGCGLSERFPQSSISVYFFYPPTASFYGTLSTRGIYNHILADSSFIVKIDTNDVLTRLAIIDRSWRLSSMRFLTDSIILYTTFSDSTIYLYNFISKERSIFLKDREIVSLTPNGLYVAVKPKGYTISFIEIYRIDNLKPRLEAHRDSCEFYTSFDDAIFIGAVFPSWMNRTVLIMDEHLNSIDTLPENLHWQSISRISFSGQNFTILCSRSSATANTLIVNYNLETGHIDTLFQRRYFAQVIPLKQPGLYLLQGKTMEEYDEMSKEQMKEWKAARKKGSYIDFAPQGGYWMIGNSIDHSIKVIVLEGYFVTVSSDGSYAMFYTNKDGEYSCKVMKFSRGPVQF
jgi:hypothetical protein